jgi:hypothetical protein
MKRFTITGFLVLILSITICHLAWETAIFSTWGGWGGVGGDRVDVTISVEALRTP